MGRFASRSGDEPLEVDDTGGELVLSVSEQTELAVSEIPLTQMTGPGLEAQVRTVFAGLLGGEPFDKACKAGGFASAAFMAIAVANESVMSGLAGIVRIAGIRSTFKVMNIADKIERQPAHYQSQVAAARLHQWFAQNAIPEMQGRAAGNRERREHIAGREERSKRDGAKSVRFITGVEEEAGGADEVPEAPPLT